MHSHVDSKIYIGTSGWSYANWKDNFYPLALKSHEWLHYYAQHFSTVEINSTFYHIPRETTIKNWTAQVPKNFLFSLKINRKITHENRLENCEEELLKFYHSIEFLKDKVGVLLLQLPPSLKANILVLEKFIECLSKKFHYAIEFRHVSWFTEEVYSLLTANNIALVISHLNGECSPIIKTANFTYTRLHGPKIAYEGSYSSKEIETWKKKLSQVTDNDHLFCYFDNTRSNDAVPNAKNLVATLLQ